LIDGLDLIVCYLRQWNEVNWRRLWDYFCPCVCLCVCRLSVCVHFVWRRYALQRAPSSLYVWLVVLYRVVQKTDTQFYFWYNFGNSAPILTILSLLQAEIYGA